MINLSSTRLTHITAYLISFICALLLGITIFFIHHDWIDFTSLEQYDPGTPTILLDDENKEWARFQQDKREPITFEQLPKHVIDAFVAAEDHAFWSHHGISYKGIIRSLLINCYHGKIIQGASTITQQLIKLLFFDSRKTMGRKIKEQWYALIVERRYSKEFILQTYLNNIYFGVGIYGVEAAAQRFWGIPITQVSVEQAAVLAAIVKSPAQYCPLLCPLSAQKRRNIVLDSMHQLGYIDHITYTTACSTSLKLQPAEKQIAPHFKAFIQQHLEQLFPKETVYAGGLVVYTTLNKELQIRAEQIFNEQVTQLRSSLNPDIDGALMTIDSQTGEIKVMIGGYDYNNSQFNRTTQAKRQYGSIFKPIIYAAALEKGLNFADTDVDEPIVLEHNNTRWEPHNYTNSYEGRMTLARALAYSNNIVTVKTLLNTGIDYVIKCAKRFNIQSLLPPYPSLALGCIDGTLKEAIGFFNVFANNGIFVEPHAIRYIKNAVGVRLPLAPATTHPVLERLINDQVRSVLNLGIDRIRVRTNRQFAAETIGKTGTTNDCRTCWFCGSTPSYTTGVYMGCDDNRSLGHYVFPVTTAFPIWARLNESIEHPRKQFSIDASLKEKTINCYTGILCNKYDPQAISILLPTTSA